MAEVLLFHHAHGLTTGVRSFADELRDAGHVVHAPDLYDGRVFDVLDDGIAFAQLTGFDAILERGRIIAEALPGRLVYVGFSLGVLPAQMLAQTRPDAAGAILCHAAIPPSEFGRAWPDGVPLQIHMMEGDEIARADGDLAVARELAGAVEGAELFLYDGEQHLFADESLPGYEKRAASLLTERVLAFLAEVG